MSDSDEVAAWIGQRELAHAPWPVLEVAERRCLSAPCGMPFVGICHMHVDSGLVQCRIEVESTPQMDDLVAIMANPCVPGVESLNVETKPAECVR